MDDNKAMKIIVFAIILLMFGLLLIFGSIGLKDIKVVKHVEEKEQEEIKEEKEEVVIEENKEEMKKDIFDEYQKSSVIIYYPYEKDIETYANYLNERLGAELIKLETMKTYPQNESGLFEEINNEKNNFSYPKLKNNLDLSTIDIVYVITPLWFGELARPIYSLFDDYGLEGKIIVPMTFEKVNSNTNVKQLFLKLNPNLIVVSSTMQLNNENKKDYKTYIDSWLLTVKNEINN